MQSGYYVYNIVYHSLVFRVLTNVNLFPAGGKFSNVYDEARQQKIVH